MYPDSSSNCSSIVLLGSYIANLLHSFQEDSNAISIACHHVAPPPPRRIWASRPTHVSLTAAASSSADLVWNCSSNRDGRGVNVVCSAWSLPSPMPLSPRWQQCTNVLLVLRLHNGQQGCDCHLSWILFWLFTIYAPRGHDPLIMAADCSSTNCPLPTLPCNGYVSALGSLLTPDKTWLRPA